MKVYKIKRKLKNLRKEVGGAKITYSIFSLSIPLPLNLSETIEILLEPVINLHSDIASLSGN